MDKNSNLYLISYAAIMAVIVAVVLSTIAEVLKEPQEKNELLAKKTDILKSVGMDTVSNLEQFYEDKIEGFVIDNNGEKIEGMDALDVSLEAQADIKNPEDKKYPLFVYTSSSGEKNFIVPMRGFGLWGPIWGYIAFQADLNTVKGIAFDHESETPGLGAEITKDWFQDSFVGKEIYSEDEFVGVEVKKGKINREKHQVPVISGATITADGVTEMIKDDVSSYLPYFEKIKNS